MTREEAIKILRIRKEYATLIKEDVLQEAIDLAIEAFESLPSVDQKTEYIIPSGDVMFTSEVMRCKDCRYRKKVGTSYYCELDEFNVKDTDFCSWGERREE